MHTISKDGDGTWCVGRMELQAEPGCGSYHGFMVLLKGMSFLNALRMCSVLNGGPVSSFIGYKELFELEEHAC